MIKNSINKKPWIKICGLTDPDNAIGCASLGADAIGLVFYKKSPRNVSMQQAARISKALPAHIKTIGVFVNAAYEDIMEKVNQCGLKGVQLHGNEPPALVNRLVKENLLVIKALFAAKKPFLNQVLQYDSASFILVEYGKGVLPGGNAEAWDYEISCQLKTKTGIVLAGGLGPENIKEAIHTAKPAGVDVSSSVEKSHGVKDLDLVKDFIVRACSAA